MKKITSAADMAHIAAVVRHAGELLESSGLRALHVTESWQPGPSSASLEPDRGNRTETVADNYGHPWVVNIPSDPTGEKALQTDDLAGDHKRLLSLVRLLEYACGETIHLLRKAVPAPEAVIRPVDMTAAQVSAAGWCVSCWQDGNYCEPVAVRPDGSRRFRDHCLWCGRFMEAHAGITPPLELLKARHRGERINATMVERALARLAEEQKRAKAEKRKKGKRKQAA